MKKTIVFAFILLTCISVLFAQDANKERSGLSADTITAICGVFIAAFALFITWWQAKETRKHNRLSVKPYIQFSYVATSKKTNRFGIEIKNDGIGPAIIKEMKLFLDDKPINTTNTLSLLIFLNQLNLEIQEGDDSPSIHILQKDSALPANEKITFFSCETKNSENEKIDVFNRIDIVIDYESMYGDSFTETLRKQK